MRRIPWVAGLSAALLTVGAARASGPLAVFGVIDKVVVEPNAEPTRVLLWGTFVTATTRPGEGLSYGKPAFGFLYYAIVPGEEDQCRREWSDMQKHAGTGEVLGWGDVERGGDFGRVRRATAPKGQPGAFPISSGVVLMRAGSNVPPAHSLRSTPAPVAPADGDEVAAGPFELKARNLPGNKPGVKYQFEIVNAAGDKETSPEVAQGKETTSWKPRMEVKAGEKYTWRVWAVSADGGNGPDNSATFQGKKTS
jgi:hypothetical protein